MKFKILFLILFTLLSTVVSFAQLANQNTYLFAHKNDHQTPAEGEYQYAACWGYVAPNGREYAIIGCFPGTIFYDITDSSNVHEVGFVPSTNPGNSNNEWREMKVYSHYAYIVSEVTNSGVQIVDLQYLPDSVHYLGKFLFGSFTKAHSISQSGPYLYLNGGNVSVGQSNQGGIHVLDLTSNPEVPVVRGVWGTRYIHDCRVINDTIWGANIYPASQGGTGSIYVINATNKDNLTTINSWVNNPFPGPHNVALTTDHHYALTTDEIGEQPGSQLRELKIWNVQNLSNVVQVAVWQPTGITTAIVHNVEVYGNYAVIAHYAAGIRVVNISNPASPTEVAWYDTYPANNVFDYLGCWGVFMFPSGKIIGSDMKTGLYIIKTTFNITASQNNNNEIPKDYSLNQNFPNPFNPSTTISYSLPKNTYATLKVYDALGKQVALLADDYKNAGNYSVTYDASNLASGMYFYSLTTTDGFSQTKKMILVK